VHCSWRNSWVDRLQNHSGSYGSRRIGRTVKPDAVQNRIGQTVTARHTQNHSHTPDDTTTNHFTVRLGEMSGLAYSRVRPVAELQLINRARASGPMWVRLGDRYKSPSPGGPLTKQICTCPQFRFVPSFILGAESLRAQTASRPSRRKVRTPS